MFSRTTSALNVLTEIRQFISVPGSMLITGAKLALPNILANASSIVINPYVFVESVKQAIDFLTGKGGYAGIGGDIKRLFGRDPYKIPNMYYQLIMDTENTSKRDIKDVKADVEAFKKYIIFLKSTICAKGEEYTLSSSQLSDIKKFEPRAAEKEMTEAGLLSESVSPEFNKVVKDFVTWWNKEVIQYLLSDIQ